METSVNTNTLPLTIVGKVVKGFGRGSKELGVPTANIDPQVVKNLQLQNGVYFGLAQVVINSDGNLDSDISCNKLTNIFHKSGNQCLSKVCPMCCSCGYNPFYGNKEKTLEVHILENIEMDLYNAEMRIAICGKIRDERNFESLDHLKKAIECDIQTSREALESPQWLSLKSDKNIFILS